MRHTPTIKYQVRKSTRVKRMRIAVYCDGSVIVTVPQTFDIRHIDSFIERKKSWIREKIAWFLASPVRRLGAGSKRDYREHKDAALALAQKRVAFFNDAFYGFSFRTINIKNQKTRWGSCSKKGNLNFNYRILFLPEHMRDYIIVHELCHLKEFNHSKKFWTLVQKALPDYNETRLGLRN